MKTGTNTFSSLTPLPTICLSRVPKGNTNSPHLKVAFGQKTFDSEGLEGSRCFFSRAIHWPGGASGVTIGRGYDMGQRTRLQIERELVHAGLGVGDARYLSMAAGLRGGSAERFVRENQRTAPILPLLVQKNLFEAITSVETIADIKRIMTKPDVVERYGVTEWGALPLPIQELVFDLRYRGDYKPETRVRLQPLIVQSDVRGLYDLMNDHEYWSEAGVPDARIKARVALLESAFAAANAA